MDDYFDAKEKIYGVSYARDRSYIAAGGLKGRFIIVNTTTRSSPTLEAEFKNTPADSVYINSVRVSFDCNFVASARSDGVIDIYARYCQ